MNSVKEKLIKATDGCSFGISGVISTGICNIQSKTKREHPTYFNLQIVTKNGRNRHSTGNYAFFKYMYKK